MLSEVEKRHHVAKPIARQTLCPKHRVLIGNGEGRVVGTSQSPVVRFLVLDLAKWPEPAARIEFKYLSPTRKPLISAQGGTLFYRSQISKVLKVNNALVFHRARLFMDRPQSASLRREDLKARLI
jgi:hypothetical protein